MLTGALLGAGNIARNGHLPAYLRCPEVRSRLRITAVADFCAENLEAVAAVVPGVRTYTDPDELLALERPDFVDICTPPYAHRALVERAVRSGCHVLCEKPLATYLDDAIAIRRTVERHGAVLFPCHQYHYAPQWTAVRRALDANEVGPIRLGVLTVQRVGANAGNGSWQPTWRTEQRLAGGGILVDHGTHLFYQLHAVFGAPASIACRTERRLHGHGVDDTATVYLQYSRRVVRIHLSWAASARYSSHRYFGEWGEVALHDDRVTIRSATRERCEPFGDGLSAGSAHSDWFSPLLVEFADRIVAGDHRLDRLDEAVVTAAYITLAYASAARDGRPVPWKDPIEMATTETMVAAG